jgi:hypothetical protein
LSPDQPTSSPPPGAKPLWGSYDGKGGAPAPAKSSPVPSPAGGSRRPRIEIASLFGGDDLDPLSQRLLKLAGALSVLLVLVLLNSFLNGGGSSPSSPSSSAEQLELNPVASAASRLEDDMSARMSLYIVYSSRCCPDP